MTSIINIVKKQLSNVKIVEKNSSFIMKLIAHLMFWQTKSFMEEYCTTWGNTIYVPSFSFVETNAPLLLHEVVHTIDYNKNKLLYVFLYALPFPFLFRANYEKRGYLTQVYARIKTIPNYDPKADWKRIVDTYFHSSVYLWMNPFQNYDLPSELISDVN